jgi:hypothetical protein
VWDYIGFWILRFGVVWNGFRVGIWDDLRGILGFWGVGRCVVFGVD